MILKVTDISDKTELIEVSINQRGDVAMKKLNEEYFRDWNYKKHAKFCTLVYAGLYAFDMTVSYFIIKKLFKKWNI